MDHMRIDNLMDSMRDNIKQMVSDKRQRIELLKEIIEASDPKAILKKGYSVITDDEGNIIKDASSLKENQLINIEAAVGQARARVIGSGKEQ